MGESLSAQAELHFSCLGWLTFRNSYPKPSLTFCISLHSRDGIGDPSAPVPTQTVLRFWEITRGMILLNTLGSSNRNQNFLKVGKTVLEESQCIDQDKVGRRCIPFSTDMRAAVLKERRTEHLSVSWKPLRKDYVLHLNK